MDLSSVRVVDIALAALALEAALLALWARKGRAGGLTLADVLGQLSAGALLLVALRAALTGAAGWVLVLVAASLPAHLFDLVRRLRSAKAPRKPDG